MQTEKERGKEPVKRCHQTERTGLAQQSTEAKRLAVKKLMPHSNPSPGITCAALVESAL